MSTCFICITRIRMVTKCVPQAPLCDWCWRCTIQGTDWVLLCRRMKHMHLSCWLSLEELRFGIFADTNIILVYVPTHWCDHGVMWSYQKSWWDHAHRQFSVLISILTAWSIEVTDHVWCSYHDVEGKWRSCQCQHCKIVDLWSVLFECSHCDNGKCELEDNKWRHIATGDTSTPQTQLSSK